MKVRISKTAAYAIALAFLFNSVAAASTYSNLKDMRYSCSRECTRVVFDLSKPTAFKDYLSNDQQSLFIELKDCKNLSGKNSIILQSSLIGQVQINSDKKSPHLLIRISLDKSTGYKIFALKPYRGKPNRIVADFFRSKKQNKPTAPSTTDTSNKKNIIVIDPGHGGQDPGAIGDGGTKEKDIVLQIAKRLKNYINQNFPDIQIHLTRDSDYFIPLGDRVKIAKQYKPDLFISLHTNASKKKYVHGASVFYLSETGASDKASELLAARENSSDLIAGVKLSEDRLVNTILIDLVQTYTINESIQLCNKTLKGLQSSGFQNDGIKCANFAVLKSPSIPSVLLEIGYITNRQDEKKLTCPQNQQRIAQQLAESVSSYFIMKKEPVPILSQSKANIIEKSTANTRF